MIDYELFKPIRNFGSLIMAFGVAGLIYLIIFINNPQFLVGARIFVLVVSSFNLFMGYNIEARNILQSSKTRYRIIYQNKLQPAVPPELTAH